MQRRRLLLSTSGTRGGPPARPRVPQRCSDEYRETGVHAGIALEAELGSENDGRGDEAEREWTETAARARAPSTSRPSTRTAGEATPRARRGASGASVRHSRQRGDRPTSANARSSAALAALTWGQSGV